VANLLRKTNLEKTPEDQDASRGFFSKAFMHPAKHPV